MITFLSGGYSKNELETLRDLMLYAADLLRMEETRDYRHPCNGYCKNCTHKHICADLGNLVNYIDKAIQTKAARTRNI